MGTREGAVRAIDKANTVRRERVRLRNDLANGTTTLATVLADPPRCILNMPILDFLRVVVWHHTYRSTTPDRQALAFNRLGFNHGLNLMVPIHRASPSTLAWVAENAPPRVSGRRAVPGAHQKTRRALTAMRD